MGGESAAGNMVRDVETMDRIFTGQISLLGKRDGPYGAEGGHKQRAD